MSNPNGNVGGGPKPMFQIADPVSSLSLQFMEPIIARCTLALHAREFN
jgi:hypothetical protein